MMRTTIRLNTMDTNNRGEKMEHVKQTVDALSITSIAATLFGYLPEISAGVGLIWTLIRIYETKTVQKLLSRRRQKKCHE